jgi:hypothetical protein
VKLNDSKSGSKNNKDLFGEVKKRLFKQREAPPKFRLFSPQPFRVGLANGHKNYRGMVTNLRQRRHKNKPKIRQ